ncbi:MAG: ABC transporter permease subunit [SAR202 cluster bacterium]|nr:hypothetical protein [Chloroflexota bacterium]MQF84478.1 ABC transporter permease subunit [SAR202 cluster bacterium]|tara:strand:- start:2488 stop:3111 length:624 start_codon:yes stop_codon:yes gene_type:complete
MNYLEILLTTLKISLTATILCFIFSIILILVARKFKKTRLFFDFITSLPLALPPVISGYVIIILSNGRLSFEWFGGSLACAVISLPLVYRMIFVTILNVDQKLVNTSRILGANIYKTFFYVIFPSIRTGLISSIFIGFIRSISEFGATMIVAGNISGKTQTLSTAIYTSIQTGNRDSILALSLISLTIAVITILTFNFINKKGFNYE